MDTSGNYILFSPTHLAAARERAELQRSLRNQSASVLTPPTGLEANSLNDTVPQPGSRTVSHSLEKVWTERTPNKSFYIFKKSLLLACRSKLFTSSRPNLCYTILFNMSISGQCV